MKIEIPHNFEPRPYQVGFYNCLADGYKRAVAVWHRRAGKDKTMLNICIKEMLKRVGNYYYYFPTYRRGKDILWDGKDKSGFPFMDHFPRELVLSKNKTEMKIELKNGSLFKIIGTDKQDSVVGPNPVGCVFSEYSLQNPEAWGLIRPILAENNGWAIFNYTPRGKNHGWDMWQMAKNNPEWYSETLSVDDTGAITKEQIDAERRADMSEDLVRQEFYCSFEASVPGAYYAEEMRRVMDEGRICRVAPERGVPVYTFWDLGIDDSTTIWLTQFVGSEIHLVYSYSNAGQALVHYVNKLKDWRDSKGVTFAKHVFPHDGKNRSLQTGKSILEVASELGLECDYVGRPKSKEIAIETVRQLLGRCWFDEIGCDEHKGIEGMKQYRKEYNEENGVYATRPVHNWASHWADAFQTLASYYQYLVPPERKKQSILSGVTGGAVNVGYDGPGGWMSQ